MTQQFEPDEYFNQVILDIVADAVAESRAIIPGKVGEVIRASNGEREVNFLPGIGRRQAGELVADGPVASAPVMSLGGGGWSMLWPMLEGDEALGLAVDRNSQRWRQNREIGDAHSFTRSHDESDAFLLPFTLTAADGAPSDPGDDFVISNRAERLRIEEGGPITITKVSDGGGPPTPVATISLEASGSITLDVQAGQTVNAGGSLSLTLWNALSVAMDAMFTAGDIAGTGAPGTTGTLAFKAAKEAWDTALGISSPETTITKGQ